LSCFESNPRTVNFTYSNLREGHFATNDKLKFVGHSIFKSGDLRLASLPPHDRS
jgi:hypothetical protein